MGRRIDASYIIGLAFILVFIIGNPIVLISIIVICAFVFLITRTNNINPNFNIQNQNKGTVYSNSVNSSRGGRTLDF